MCLLKSPEKKTRNNELHSVTLYMYNIYRYLPAHGGDGRLSVFRTDTIIRADTRDWTPTKRPPPPPPK